MPHDSPTQPLPPAWAIAQAVADALERPALARGEVTVAWSRTALRKRVVEYHVREPGLHPDEGRPAIVVGKVYTKPERGAAAHALLAYLRGSGFGTGPFTVPRPIAWLADWRMLLVGRAPGRQLVDALIADPADATGATLAARWLAQLHATPRPDFLPAKEARAAAGLDRFASELPPALSPAARVPLGRLLARLDAPVNGGAAHDVVRPVLLHGDFHPQNVFVDGTGADAGVSAIDLDHARVGDPAWDLGYLLGQMRDTARERLGDPSGLEHVADATREAYLATVPPAEREGIARRAAGHEAATLVESLHYRRCILHLPAEPDDAALLAAGSRVLEAGG